MHIYMDYPGLDPVYGCSIGVHAQCQTGSSYHSSPFDIHVVLLRLSVTLVFTTLHDTVSQSSNGRYKYQVSYPPCDIDMALVLPSATPVCRWKGIIRTPTYSRINPFRSAVPFWGQTA